MEFNKKLELIKAVCLVSDFWEVEPTELLYFVRLIKKDKIEKWNKIAKEFQEFREMDLEGRAKKLGIALTINKK